MLYYNRNIFLNILILIFCIHFYYRFCNFSRSNLFQSKRLEAFDLIPTNAGRISLFRVPQNVFILHFFYFLIPPLFVLPSSSFNLLYIFDRTWSWLSKIDNADYDLDLEGLLLRLINISLLFTLRLL